MDALIIGGASCVWDDVAALEILYGRRWDGMVIAVNDIGAHWPRKLHHWVSLHPSKFKKWLALREKHQMYFHGPTWGRAVSPLRMWGGCKHFCDYVLKPWPGGSSGMFGVQVAHHLGCNRVVLCGIPMTSTAHFEESREGFAAQWGAADFHWKAWIKYQDRMLGWVKSMSGRTAELLGHPTPSWLNQP